VSERARETVFAWFFDQRGEQLMFVYQKSRAGLWTVGYYDPAGKWRPGSDQDSEEKAAAPARYINCGNDQDPPRTAAILQSVKHVERIEWLLSLAAPGLPRDAIREAVHAHDEGFIPNAG
jgi:hypothetical protein